jgi:hypothetical protein
VGLSVSACPRAPGTSRSHKGNVCGSAKKFFAGGAGVAFSCSAVLAVPCCGLFSVSCRAAFDVSWPVVSWPVRKYGTTNRTKARMIRAFLHQLSTSKQMIARRLRALGLHPRTTPARLRNWARLQRTTLRRQRLLPFHCVASVFVWPCAS